AGDITLEADNAALLDATLRSSTQTGDTADAISLAFNSVGWQPQNVLFNTIDAILGDPLVSKAFNGELDADAEHLTRAHAHITDSTVDADGNVSLDAYNDAQLNATVSNAAESAASALFGAGGQAFGAVLASNKVSGEAKAWVDGTSSVDAGAGICVNAEDNTGIYANSKIVSSSITTNDGGAAAIQETLNDVVPVDYDTGNALLSPSVDLKFGDRIRLSDSFSDDTVSGAGNDGSIYIFLGDAAAGTGLDLRNLDYTDLELFKQDPVTNLVPQGLNVSESDSKALGGLIVLNDVRAGVEAYIDGVDVTAKDGDIAITALENATIDATTDGSVVSSGGSAFGTGTSSAKNGVVATNVVQSSASAWSQSNTLSASDAGSGLGNLLVDAKNTSALDATTKGSTQSGDSAVGAVLAFNSVGWNASNVLFNAVDALLGDPIVSEAFDGAGDGAVEAYLREVKVVADGDLDVHAEASGSINAMLDNDATSAASALIDASGSAAAVVLASNKVNSSADAWIDNSGLILDPALPDIDIGGALTVESKDTAAITADTSLKAMSTVTNDAGASMLADLADAAIRDYLFTNLSGFVHIEQGQQVYVGDSHAAGGLAGSIYRYTGAGEDVDLSTTNFEAGPWSELNPVDFSSDQGLQSVQAGIPSLGIVPQAVLDAFLPSEYEGTVVRVMEGANAGGNVGSNYRYVGEDGMLDLSTQDYSDTENWVEVTGTVSSIVSELPLNVSDSDSSAVGALFVVNDVRSDVDAVIDHATVLADGDVSVIALENAGIVASDSSTVTSAGGSLTGGSSTAINGVVATNAVLSGADAHIANSDIETTGDAQVIVDADNTSLINAVVESNTKSNGTSVGVTLAFNTIGWNSQNFLFNTLDAVLGTDIGSANPSKVEAYILHSDVLAGGGIDIGAGSSANIDATIETGTTSIVTGVSTSKAVSVGAIVAMNKINTGASAYIDSSNSIVASDGDIALHSTDTSTIDADISVPSLSVSLGNQAKSVSVGLAIARNEISNTVDAFIRDTALVEAGDGNVLLNANENATINAIAGASSVSVAVSATQGAQTFSGGGAIATNVIAGSVGADIIRSRVEAAISDNGEGSVIVDADNTSHIDARISALSVSVSASTGQATAASIGISVARNFIGYDEVYDYTSDGFATDEFEYTSNQIPETITAGDRVRLTEDYDPNNDREGEIFQYSGPDLTGNVDLAAQTYTGANGWTRIENQQTLANGDIVRLADDYSNGGEGGALYEYLGADGIVDIGREDYDVAARW
ncbi:MAG: hypothetical protein PVJ78_13640, partial [Gammaproteobacteria bacterium]